MARENQYDEPWTEEPDDGRPFLVEAVDSKGQYRPVIDNIGFLRKEDFDRMLLCVKVCAGRTNAELKRGVVPKRK